MDPARAGPSANHLPATSPTGLWQRVRFALDPVRLELGQVLIANMLAVPRAGVERRECAGLLSTARIAA